MVDKQQPVTLDRISDYDSKKIKELVINNLRKLGVPHIFDGKRVVIKPNLVMKASPEAAATTHPAVLEGVIEAISDKAAKITVAESPGGLYTKETLKAIYRTCGIETVCEKHNIELNYDTSHLKLQAPKGKTSKNFDIITPIADAEIIINLAKLKSHSLTGYSGAVKNYFGTIPGVTKFEMHSRFPDYKDFSSMLVDLCEMLLSRVPTFNILDGIVAMEGNGPTGGNPRKLDCMIMSCNPFSADILATHIIKTENVLMLKEGIARELCEADIDSLNIISDEEPDNFIVNDFKKPDTSSKGGSFLLKKLPNMFGGKLNKWLQPRPRVNNSKCVGCGECKRSCPKSTIKMKQTSKGKKAVILDDNCIKCYCCQELCPFKAIRIKKNPIIKLIGG